MSLLGYKDSCKPNGAIVVEGEGGKEIDSNEFVSHVIMQSGGRASPS